MVCNSKQRYLYSSQTRRATMFQSCPPGDGKESLHFLFLGSAVERSILDKQSVSSITPPCFCCFFVFFSANPKYVGSNPPVPAFLLLFFSAVLLYCCCCTVVNTWWVRGLLVDGFSAVYVLYLCTIRRTAAVQSERVGGLIGTSTTHVAHHSENPRQASYRETSSCAQPIHRLTCLRVEA